MLSLTKLADADYLLNQVALGIDEYYLGGGEAPGVWHGAWAAELGLEGVVDAEDLRALLEGRHPVTGQDLLAGRPARRFEAFDATLSAPKSVSLLWALATPEVSAAVSIAHVEAVTAALDVLEARAGLARRQIGGVRRREATSGLAVATFVHGRRGRATPNCIPTASSPTWCAGPTGATWPSTAGQSLSGRRRWAPSTRRSCAGASPPAWASAGDPTATAVGRWRASGPPSCGPSPSAAWPSRPTWRPWPSTTPSGPRSWPPTRRPPSPPAPPRTPP